MPHRPLRMRDSLLPNARGDPRSTGGAPMAPRCRDAEVCAESNRHLSTRAAAPTRVAASGDTLAASLKTKCDRCDKVGHDEQCCPYFKQPRARHADAARPSSAELAALREGRDEIVQGDVIRQPGDNSCFWHSALCELERLDRIQPGELTGAPALHCLHTTAPSAHLTS